MRPGDHERIPTVSEAVREATAIVDPEGTDTATLGPFESFEDDDRPATAAAVWLATKSGQAENGDHVLREGTRLVFEGNPPSRSASG